MHSAKTFRACGPCVPALMRSSITAFLSMGIYMGAIFVPCLPLGHAKPWIALSHAPTFQEEDATCIRLLGQSPVILMSGHVGQCRVL